MIYIKFNQKRNIQSFIDLCIMYSMILYLLVIDSIIIVSCNVWGFFIIKKCNQYLFHEYALIIKQNLRNYFNYLNIMQNFKFGFKSCKSFRLKFPLYPKTLWLHQERNGMFLYNFIYIYCGLGIICIFPSLPLIYIDLYMCICNL